MNALPFSYEHPSLAQERVIDVLRLIRSENVGPVTFFRLLSHFGSAAKALEAIPDMSVKGGRARPIRVASLASAQEEMEKVTAFGARVVLYGQPDYPALLHTVHDAPPLLMVRGSPSVWQRGANIGMVGARNASANACRFAHKLAADLGKAGVCIVSGLARGVDAAAHQGALASGTVGVIAGGIDTLYPPENKDLYRQMAEQGAIISEQPFGHAPQARSFPARNRIISGMSQGVVVIEASLKSGSLITAKQAAEQNRDVFAVPGSPMDPRCVGSNQLLRDGAILTASAEDVLMHLRASHSTTPLAEPQAGQYRPAPARQPDESTLQKARMIMVQKLSHEPVLVDELIMQCQLTAGVVMTVLLEMELAGRLNRHPGNRVSMVFEPA